MSLERLWAGWRSSYVSSFSDDGTAASPGAQSQSQCVFCAIVGSQKPDAERYLLWRGSLTVAILNAYPYSPGHVMVMPARHVRELEELDDGEATELHSALFDAVAAVKSAYRPEGMNIGLNLGRAAGAGIPAHLHVHIVPRWIGDTNFMTSVAETRVLPEALSDSWAKLRAAWK